MSHKERDWAPLNQGEQDEGGGGSAPGPSSAPSEIVKTADAPVTPAPADTPDDARLTEVLENLPRGDQAAWRAELAAIPLTPGEVVALIDEPPKRSLTIRRKLTILKHGFRRWRRDGHLAVRLLYMTGWLSILITAAIKAGGGFAIGGAAAIILAKIRFMIRDLRPKNMEFVRRGYNERKVELTKLVQTIQLWHRSAGPTEREVKDFQTDVLALIANYVRDHRLRFGSKCIVANLLVRDGDQIVVVGRSDGLRPVPRRYSVQQCELVHSAFTTTSPKLTGDLYEDFPNAPTGKKYCSVMVLPVWFDGEMVAAVTIDSSEKYHFHVDYDDLQTQLAPYVQLLADTVRASHVRSGRQDGGRDS